MKLLWVLLVLLVLHESMAWKRFGRTKKKIKNRQIGTNILKTSCRWGCRHGSYCRAIKYCRRWRSFFVTKCLRCVPEGADQVCNNNRYYRAVLIAKGRGFNPLNCRLSSKGSCPHGSVCSPNKDIPGYGVCCYGKPAPTYKGPVSNKDFICNECGKECSKGYTCQKHITNCGHLTHACRRAPKLN